MANFYTYGDMPDVEEAVSGISSKEIESILSQYSPEAAPEMAPAFSDVGALEEFLPSEERISVSDEQELIAAREAQLAREAAMAERAEAEARTAREAAAARREQERIAAEQDRLAAERAAEEARAAEAARVAEAAKAAAPPAAVSAPSPVVSSVSGPLSDVVAEDVASAKEAPLSTAAPEKKPPSFLDLYEAFGAKPSLLPNLTTPGSAGLDLEAGTLYADSKNKAISEHNKQVEKLTSMGLLNPEMKKALDEGLQNRLSNLEKDQANYAQTLPQRQQLSKLLSSNQFSEAYKYAQENNLQGLLTDPSQLKNLRSPFTREEAKAFVNSMPESFIKSAVSKEGADFDKLFKFDPKGAEDRGAFVWGTTGPEGFKISDTGYPMLERALEMKSSEKEGTGFDLLKAIAIGAAVFGAGALINTLATSAGLGSAAAAGAGTGAGATGAGTAAGAAGAGAAGAGATGAGVGAAGAGAAGAAGALPTFTVTTGAGLGAGTGAALTAGAGAAGAALGGGGGGATTTAPSVTEPSPLDTVVEQPPVTPEPEIVVTGSKTAATSPLATAAPVTGAATTAAQEPITQKTAPEQTAPEQEPTQEDLEEIEVTAKRAQPPDLVVSPIEPFVSSEPSPLDTPFEEAPTQEDLEEITVTGKKPFDPALTLGTGSLTEGFTEPNVDPVTGEPEVVVKGTKPQPLDVKDVAIGAVGAGALTEGFREPNVDPVTGEPKEPSEVKKEIEKIDPTAAPPPTSFLDKLKELLGDYATPENILKLLGGLAAGASSSGTVTKPTGTGVTGGLGGALPKYEIKRTQLSPDIDYYTYGTRPEARFFEYAQKVVEPTQPPAKEPETGMATGGLTGYAAGGSNRSRYMAGEGSGRDDKIPALLSDGEYVMDAETLALLGDGSTKEGARRMDQFRANIRRHKGRALSRGQISPDAKSPDKYMGGGLT